MIYSNTAQLVNLLLAVKYMAGGLIPSEFDPIDSCVYSTVPVFLNGKYRITLPDPGEYVRALAGEDEIIYSLPADKVELLITQIISREEMKMGYRHYAFLEFNADFPRPAEL